MAERVEVCAVADLPAGEATTVETPKDIVAVFNVDGDYFACSNSCPHAGAPLYQGFVTGTTISCPWHGWRFELNPEGDPPKDGVCRYTLEVNGDALFVVLPD